MGGSTVNRTERFGPMVPSAQARHDRELSAASFASYEGHAPGDTWTISNTGAHSLSLRGGRLGLTHGTCNSSGLQAPTPIGVWKDSRTTLHTRTKSKPSLV